jgi:hypothetical protein
MNTPNTPAAPPIVFVQRGVTFYFPSVLVQAARRCISSQIWVIADFDPATLLPADLQGRVSWAPIADFDGSLEHFRAVYVHMGIGRPWLEQMCFERWFMIRSLYRREGWSAFIHLDSDVLVESDVGAHLMKRTAPAVLFSRGMGPHVTFFRDITWLDKLCADILSMYGSDEGVLFIRREYDAMRSRGQAASLHDMFFFERMVGVLGDAYGDTFQIVDGEFFDHCMGMTEGYESRFGTKIVRHRGGAAYCHHLASDTWPRVLALHFQGITKIWMGWHADVRTPSDVLRSARLWCWGGFSYATRAHRYLMRKWIGLWRRWNARAAA